LREVCPLAEVAVRWCRHSRWSELSARRVMAEELPLDVLHDARAALAHAKTAHEVRQIWHRFYRKLGHRLLGKLLLTQDTIAGSGDRVRATSFGSPGVAGGGAGGLVGPDADNDAPLAHVGDHLDTFACLRRSFSLDELVLWADEEIAAEVLLDALSADSRFIRLVSLRTETPRFIPRRVVFRWLVYVNLRLASADQSRLNERELARSMDSFHTFRPNCVLEEVVNLAGNFGLLCLTLTPGEYSFPIARILSYLYPSDRRKCGAILFDLGDPPTLPSEESLFNAVKESVSFLPERTRYIIQAREGLDGSKKQTLSDIGESMELTRERIRQIEAKFYKALSYRAFQSLRTSLLRAVMLQCVAKNGSLLFEVTYQNLPLVAFAAKCLRLPFVVLPSLGVAVLGMTDKEVDALRAAWRIDKEVDPERVASSLERGQKLPLNRQDLVILGRRIARHRWRNLSKAQMVYFALREIGKPAHYSEIAAMFNDLFPERPSSEHHVHAVLGREQCGVTWVGARGMYALREWGYERPSKGIFDAVTEIVTERHAATGRPVSFAVITAEIGRYRQIINPNSLLIATQCNPSIEQVYKDAFIPTAFEDNEAREAAANELDSILKEFEKRSVTDTQGPPPSDSRDT